MSPTSPCAPQTTDQPLSAHDSALLLRFDGLTKKYGKRTVVDDLSFTVEPGRVTGFLGPNGSGKSTTMKILLGLTNAQSGHATIGGRRYRDLDEPSQMVGAALETNSFHPGRTGRNHLRIVAQTTGVSFGRVDETLDIVGLVDAADRRAGGYSLGMRQRLGLAAALLGDPPILILDEPGNGLDPQGVRSLRDLLRSRAGMGHTVLVSSHVLGEVEQLADDVVVIDDGRLVISGALKDLQQQTILVRTSSTSELQVALEAAGATTEKRDDALVVRGLTMSEIGDQAFDAGVVVHELSHHAGSLEDMFLTWTHHPGTERKVIRL